MPQIHARIIAIRDQILAEGVNSPTAERLKRKALNAIMGDQNQRVSYMAEYAQNAAELARLLGGDGTHANPGMNDARAYMLANAPCGTDTVTNLDKGVTTNLDPP